MAQKKFSRLSVMLEARDGMSKPMMAAAKASEHLQSSVRKLDSNMGQSTKGIDKLNQSTNEATHSMGYYAKAMSQAARDSAAAYVAGRVLSGMFKIMSNVVLNVSYAFKELGTRIWTAFTNTRLFQTVTGVFKTLGDNVRNYSLRLVDAIKNSRLLLATTRMYNTVTANIKSAAIAAGQLAVKIGDAVRNSKAFKAVESTIDSVKQKVAATAIAFTLWKNSSVFVQKLNNDLKNVRTAASWGFGYLKLAISDLIPKFGTLRRNIANIGQSLQQVGGRRATFNQLADSNARLNAQLAKMNSELNRGNGLLGKMGGHVRTLSNLEKLRVGANVVEGIGGRAANIGKDAFTNAMQQQYDRESMKIVVGKDKGDKFYDTVQNYAASTVYAPEEWAGSLRGVIRKANNEDELKKYMMTIEQLATIDPDQGLQGAAYAMRELASGNTKSLVARFELQKGPLEKLKKMTDPMKQAEELSKILGDQTGFSVDGITKMKEQPLMQAKAAKNKGKRAMGQMSDGILQTVAPAFEQFNKMYDEGKFKGFISGVSKGLGTAASAVMSFGMGMIKTFQSGELQSRLQPFINIFNNVKNSIVDAWPTIQQIFTNVGEIITKVANDINAAWPTVNSTFQTLLGIVKDVSGWINEHYNGVRDTVLAVGAAFLTYQALMFIEPLIMGIGTAIRLYQEGALLATAAQWLLNIALNANPFGLVVIGIAALVAAGVLLYQNWDTVKNACIDMWISVESAFARGVNASIGYINTLIEKVNSFTGMKISTINYRMSMPTTRADAQQLSDQQQMDQAYGSHRAGLNRVPYDGYKAILHEGERVLTAAETRASDKGVNGISITGNTFHVRQDSDIDAIAESLFNKLYSAKTAMG